MAAKHVMWKAGTPTFRIKVMFSKDRNCQSSNMAFAVPCAVVAAAVILVSCFHDDLGTCTACLSGMVIDIVEHDIDRLGNTTDFVRT